MRNILVSFLLLSFLVGQGSTVAQEVRGNIDLIIVVDLSASMVGKGGPQNIFKRVQQSCKDIVSELEKGDNFTLITFGEKVHSYPTVILRDDQDRTRVYDIVDHIKADQRWTYTAAALQEGLGEAKRLDKISPSHQKIIFVLTDGINDPPPGMKDKGPSLKEIAERDKKKEWFVYQVQYGNTVDRDLAGVVDSTILDPGGKHGYPLLRPFLTPKAKRHASLTAVPAELHISMAQLGVYVYESAQLSVPTGYSPEAIRPEYSAGSIPEDINIESRIVASSNGTTLLKVSALARSAVPNSEYRGTVKLEAVGKGSDVELSPCEVVLIVETRMAPARWPYWLGGVFLAMLVMSGVGLLLRLNNRRKLFGVLQYWPTVDPSKKSSMIDLGKMGKRVTIGSEKIAIPGAKNLAKLEVTAIDGTMLVVVTPVVDVKMVFNGKSLSSLVLYNNDVFTLGEYQYKYSGAATGVRPRNTR
jgi:hypothetical protein